jgi:predicted HicB family RNase H-like nuclease
MKKEKSTRPKKTFPLEMEEDLHKALKMRAIQEDKTLHALIIDTLSQQLQESPAPYRFSQKKELSQ